MSSTNRHRATQYQPGAWLDGQPAVQWRLTAGRAQTTRWECRGAVHRASEGLNLQGALEAMRSEFEEGENP